MSVCVSPETDCPSVQGRPCISSFNIWDLLFVFSGPLDHTSLCTGASEVQRCSETVILVHSDTLSMAAPVGTVCVKIVEEMKLRLVYSSILTAAIFSNDEKQQHKTDSCHLERADVRNMRLLHAVAFHTTVPFCSCFAVLHRFAGRVHELRKEVHVKPPSAVPASVMKCRLLRLTCCCFG